LNPNGRSHTGAGPLRTFPWAARQFRKHYSLRLRAGSYFFSMFLLFPSLLSFAHFLFLEPRKSLTKKAGKDRVEK
jgi:hypothetical protein